MPESLCVKCNKPISQENKFCVFCGAKIEKRSSNIKQENGGYIERHKPPNMPTMPTFLLLTAAFTILLFVGVATLTILYFSEENGDNNLNDSLSDTVDKNETHKPPTTNPAYLLSPEEFIVDVENRIFNLPDNHKSVWVEEVINEYRIKVSYIILKGGENIITFAHINLYGIESLEFPSKMTFDAECQREQAINFLKKFIEHKYVYLSDYKLNSVGTKIYIPTEYRGSHLNKKYLTRIVTILKEDVDIPELRKYYNNMEYSEGIEVNLSLARLGYTNTVYPFLYDDVIAHWFKGEEEVARVAKKGFWNICEY